MPLSGPAVASTRPSRDGLWSRRLLALTLGAVVAGLAARGLLGLHPSELDGARDLAWVVTGLHLAQQHWRPRRTGRLVWRPRVVGRYGTEPGLVAGRSIAGWVELVVVPAFGATLAVGAISLLPERWHWVAVGRPALLVAVALGLGWTVYGEIRFTGRLALTGRGIRDGGEWYPWSEIREARLNSRDRRNGVWLRLDPARFPPQVVGGRDVAVSDERLLAAIEQFRAAPEVLAVGLSVTPPEPASPS